jgi:hypothetical protein
MGGDYEVRMIDSAVKCGTSTVAFLRLISIGLKDANGQCEIKLPHSL